MEEVCLRFFRICTWVVILVLFFSFTVSANKYDQQITLSVKDAPLEKVFALIKRQSGYNFLYNNEQVKKARPVTLDVYKASLEEVLNQCFKDQPFGYSIVNQLIVVRARNEKSTSSVDGSREALPVKDVDLTGRVVNETGQPLVGITVAVKNTKIATSTDEGGLFELTRVPADAVLVFTGINIELHELALNGRTSVEVTLKTKVTPLEDVTVAASTGYQKIPKERATGSFAVVDNKTLNQQVGTNILRRLEGVASGFQFVSKTDDNRRLGISIRGVSTINGPLDPLIVVDGFIYEGSIDNINPNIVESVTILKDAAAASIWGARAGNGVIVINTKRGNFNQKLRVDFNANVIISEKPDLFYLPQISSADYIDVEQVLFNNNFFEYTMWEPWRPLTPAVDIFNKTKLGLITPADSASMINTLKSIDSRNEYRRHFYKDAITQQYGVNMRGGSGSHAYAFGIGYNRGTGQLHNTFDALNVKVENLFRPVKNLTINVGVYYTNSKDKAGMPSLNSVKVDGRTVPYLRFADEDGNALPVDREYNREYISTLGNGLLMDWNYYPLIEPAHLRQTNNLHDWNAIAGIQYKLFKWLEIDMKGQYERQNIEGEELNSLQSYYTRNLINLFSQVDPVAGTITYIIPKGDVRQLSGSTIKSYTGRGQLNINHQWLQHSIVGIVGAEIREKRAYSSSMTSYGYKEDPLVSGSVDFVNSYPTIVTGNFMNISGSPFYTNQKNRFVSFYTNMAYTYRNKYILSASARRDGANIFGALTNDKWKPLWSTGLAWHISKEYFYNSSLFPQLKLRFSYGKSGNVDTRKSPLPIASYGTDGTTNLPVALISELNDPLLRWEQITMLNIGLDFSFRNLLSGSIEYFHKKGKDLYGPFYYDYTTWGGQQVVNKNVANMKGNGIDLVLKTRNIGNQLQWQSSFLFSYVRDKTTRYFTEESGKLSTMLGGGSAITPVVGKPLYAIAGLRWGGLDASGNPQGYVNGELSTDYGAILTEAFTKGAETNVVYIGSAFPTYYGSFINTFSWKRLALSAGIFYKLGYYFQKPTINYGQLINQGLGHADFARRWQKPGDESITDIPAFIYPHDDTRDAFFANSEVNVVRGDHVRLQYVNLAYTIIRSDHQKLIKDLEIYVNASNLGILWRANGDKIDPDFVSTIPFPRSYAIGIRTNF